MSDTPSIRRIDPAAVPGLYPKWKMQPRQHGFYMTPWRGQPACGCINTILAVDKVGPTRAIPFVRSLGNNYSDAERLAIELSGLDPKYAVGLALGWDDAYGNGECAMPDIDPNLPAIRLGYADGQAAWEACRRAAELAPRGGALAETDIPGVRCP